MAQTASVYLTVLVTVERFIVVCHPLKARSLCTTTRYIIYKVSHGHCWGQFHQPSGAKCIWASSNSSVPAVIFCAFQFQTQNYALLYHYPQLENTLNFYVVRPGVYASKFSINLMAAFVPIKCWWNEALVTDLGNRSKIVFSILLLTTLEANVNF